MEQFKRTDLSSWPCSAEFLVRSKRICVRCEFKNSLRGQRVCLRYGCTRPGNLDLHGALLVSIFRLLAIPELCADFAVEFVFIDLIHPGADYLQALLKYRQILFPLPF